MSCKVAFRARSTACIVAVSAFPTRFMSRWRSTVRSWSRRTVESTWRPEVAEEWMMASLGYGGVLTFEVIAATIVVWLYWLLMSFWMISVGRVFLISWPTVGSSAVR